MLPSKLVPGPLDVLRAFPALWDEGLAAELTTSLGLNLQATGVMITVSLAVAYGSRIPLFEPVSRLFSFGRFNSFVGLPFLLTLAIGNAHWIKVTLLAMAMSVFCVPAVVDVISTIPGENYDDARALNMNEWQVLWEVVILGKFHEVIDVLRTNWAMGWCVLPMVEGIFRDEGGIGVLLLLNNKYLRLDHVYAAVILIGLLGVAMDRLILEIKECLCPYAFLRPA